MAQLMDEKMTTWGMHDLSDDNYYDVADEREQRRLILHQRAADMPCDSDPGDV